MKILFKLILLVLGVLSLLVIWQKEQLTILALTQIDPLPETKAMVQHQQYAQAYEYLDFFIQFDYVKQNPEAMDLYADIKKQRETIGYKIDKITQGIMTGSSDETLGQVAGVVSDFFVFGDIRDIAIQGAKYAKGEETDSVLIALSTIGIVATGAQIASGIATVGTAGVAAPTVAVTTATKSAITTLKAAKRADYIPSWLNKRILDIAKSSKQTKKIGDFGDIANDINKLANTKGGIKMLKQTTNPDSLKQMIRFSETFGKHSPTVYKIGGDMAVTMTKNLQKYTKNSITLATSYGKGGLKALNDMGALKFVKYTSRASKIAYKGDALRLLAKKLLDMPQWIFYLIATLALLFWMPWRFGKKVA